LKRSRGVRRGKVTPDQEYKLRRLAEEGNLALCCEGAAAAISIIRQYIDGKIQKP